jgi:PST family polysaccharide transporter/lipopolysaccharide exporter
VSTVAFPVAARLQGQREALRDAYLTMQHYMLVILAPLGFGLYAVTPTLIHLLFQAKWNAAIPVMQTLSIYMTLVGVGHWPGVIYKAVGRPDILNRLGLLKVVLLVPTLWWAAVNYGIEGVAWGQVVIRLVSVTVDMLVVSRFLQINLLANLKVVWPPLASAVVMAAAARAVFLLDPTESSVALLALAVLVGAAVYLALIWLLDRQALGSIVSLARGIFQMRNPEFGIRRN